MKTLEVKCCRDCPLFSGDVRNEPSECSHPKSVKRGSYNNIVPRSHFEIEPIPKWCPIINGHTLVKRDFNDKIISKTYIKITGVIK